MPEQTTTTPTPWGRNAGQQIEPLRAWLKKHNARWITDGRLGGPDGYRDLEGYIVNGRLVLALHYPNGNGWDLFVPPTDKNSIQETLAAAAVACGLPEEPRRVIVASLEGIKVEVYRRHAKRYTLNHETGEWQTYDSHYIPLPPTNDSLDWLTAGINEADRLEILQAVREVTRG